MLAGCVFGDQHVVPRDEPADDTCAADDAGDDAAVGGAAGFGGLGAKHDGDGEGDDAGLEDEGEDYQRADVRLGPGLLVGKQEYLGSRRTDDGLY